MIALQINLKAISKRPLRLTARSQTGFSVFVSHLKLIGEELWFCHGDGITVYDCQWKKPREIKLGGRAMSVAALDTQNVVIASYRGLIISSNSGMIVQLIMSAYFVYLTVF